MAKQPACNSKHPPKVQDFVVTIAFIRNTAYNYLYG